jgi:hypothetical protein
MMTSVLFFIFALMYTKLHVLVAVLIFTTDLTELAHYKTYYRTLVGQYITINRKSSADNKPHNVAAHDLESLSKNKSEKCNRLHSIKYARAFQCANATDHDETWQAFKVNDMISFIYFHINQMEGSVVCTGQSCSGPKLARDFIEL